MKRPSKKKKIVKTHKKPKKRKKGPLSLQKRKAPKKI